MTAATTTYRLTQYAHGGGCACKIPPGELEEIVRGLTGDSGPDLLVGLDDGDDAAVVRLDERTAVVSTADFFTPVVDDAYDWGRIAAANALSDVYAMGGRPLMAVNLVGWPRDVLPGELLTEVLRGGMDVGREAGCHVAGGHSIDDPEPKYGMAVTGIADPARLLRNDAAVAGMPISLTKPLGVGMLNNRHKSTGEVFPEAVASMVALERARPRRTPWPPAWWRDRRHRVRPAGAPVQDGARLRGDRRGRRGRGALPRRRAGGAARRLRQRRYATQPGLGPPAPRPPTSTRTSCCCSPTPRPAAGCWSWARCPAPPSSAKWSRGRTQSSASAEPSRRDRRGPALGVLRPGVVGALRPSASWCASAGRRGWCVSAGAGAGTACSSPSSTRGENP